MTIANYYEHGVNATLICSPDLEHKTISFGVSVFISRSCPLKLPDQWQNTKIGTNWFPTWPEAVDAYHQFIKELEDLNKGGHK